MFTFFHYFPQLACQETQAGCDEAALSSAPLKEALQRASTIPSEEALEAAAGMHATASPPPPSASRGQTMQKNKAASPLQVCRCRRYRPLFPSF